MAAIAALVPGFLLGGKRKELITSGALPGGGWRRAFMPDKEYAYMISIQTCECQNLFPGCVGHILSCPVVKKIPKGYPFATTFDTVEEAEAKVRALNGFVSESGYTPLVVKKVELIGPDWTNELRISSKKGHLLHEFLSGASKLS